MAGNDRFNIKLGRILSPSGTGRFVSFAGRVRRAAQNSGRSRGGGRKSNHVAESFFSRRVITKVNVVKMGVRGGIAQKLHLDYIARDSASREADIGDDSSVKKGSLYSRDENFADADAFHLRGEDDVHQFRIIVSPEDGKEIEDLRLFTRNMMSQMERDLGTKLDWVAANHYDTANPHTHIVLRGVQGDGKTMRIPRQYISHGMREMCEDIATRELGPVSQIDVALKLAAQIQQERFTSLDRDLLAKAQNQIVDLSKIPLDGSDWSHRFEKGRVKFLSKMGLAEKTGFGKWKLDENLERTLRRLGDRGDILKAYHKAMKGVLLSRSSYNEPIYDPVDITAEPIIGQVIASGILDDVNDRSYLVLDTLEGEAIFVEAGRAVNIEHIDRGMIVEVKPQVFTPKPSDYTIDNIASKRGGIYSPSVHEISDPSAREEYIQAHVRRLEAMRRAGHAQRKADGSWVVPNDYLKRASAYEKSKGFGSPVKLKLLSRIALDDLPRTIGKTWLDTLLLSGTENEIVKGFAEDVEAAKTQRRQFLIAQNILGKNAVLTQDSLNRLETLDLNNVGKELSDIYGKAYMHAPNSERISGIYREVIVRPSGKYAVIERSHEFTLVPWRATLDRSLGKSVTGIMRGQTISWTLSKGRGIT